MSNDLFCRLCFSVSIVSSLSVQQIIYQFSRIIKEYNFIDLLPCSSITFSLKSSNM